MIGIFDSGSGGITILEALHKHMPNRDFLYLGDHANAPYGHRTNEQIVDMTRESVNLLMQQGCSLVILACNTAAAIALRALQQTWLPHAWPENRILGVLVPMVEAMTGVPWSQECPNGRAGPSETIALFATQKTVKSGAYVEEVKKRAPHLHLVQKACPGLVDAIEGGAGEKPIQGLIHGYVAETLSECPATPNAVLLGCTHFPLAERHFRSALSPETRLYSQPNVVTASLLDYLNRHPELDKPGNGTVKLWTTGNPADVNTASSYLPHHLNAFEKVPSF